MVKIITDSVSDIPKEYIDRYDIKVLPLKVIFGDEVYRDGIDIDTKTMFDRLKSTNEYPTTSQVTPAEFEQEFSEVVNSGNEVICITMSSALSGTYNSALIASREFDAAKIRVIDSKAITLGYGMIVIEAAKMASNSVGIDDIESRVRDLVNNMEYLIIFDTLEYIYKGGRISKSQYMMSNLLNIKVIMTMKDGQVVAREKVRGRKKAIKYIIDYIEKNESTLDGRVIGMNHANDESYLEELKEAVLSKYLPSETIYSEVGCTVAAYSGLSAVALYYEKAKK